MKRFSLLLLLIFTVGFISCEDESSGPTGPVLTPAEDLTATALSDAQIKLTWTDTSPFEMGYRVQRALGGVDSWSNVAELERDVKEYNDTGLDEGTEYRYRVKTYDAQKESEPSNIVSAVTLAKPPVEPSAMQDTIAIQENRVFTNIKLTWSDESEKEDGYQIQRKLGSRGTYEVAADLDADIEEYLDEGLESNERYYYQIRAMIDTVGSRWSIEVNARTDVLTPPTPTDIAAEAVSSTSIRIRWISQSGFNLGFLLERSLVEDTDWALLDTLEEPMLQSYLDDGLSDETTYYYRVASYNSYGSSEFSETAEATTPVGPPDVPSNLRADNITYESVTLYWDDTDDETSYRMERRIAGAHNWFRFPLIDRNITILNDITVSPDKEYQYRILASNASGSSDFSEILEVTTPDGPPHPPTINAEARSISEILITWVPHIAGNHDGFTLERSIGAADNFGPLAEFGYGENSYNDTDLEEGTTYYYRMYSGNDIGRSGYSNIVSATTEAVVHPIFEDGFETYTIDQQPSNPPWSVVTNNSSTVLISGNNPYAGQKYLHFDDSNATPEDSAGCSAFVTTESVIAGTISMWLKIAPNGFLGIVGGDSSPNHYITFQIQFNADNTMLVRNGGDFVSAQNYPVGQWFKFEIVFDTPNHSWYFKINDGRIPAVNLQRADHPGNSMIIFAAFNNTVLQYGGVDELSVTDVIETAPPLGTSSLPGELGTGEDRIGDFRMIEK
ncbi:MAG: fibronectin type III domain-containing protein [Candidatus Hatepunaea meridiana]|nr:fibronectin type III domain-containing protein [Candidatus Hatepunaea meridiana]